MSECRICGLSKTAFGETYNPLAHCRCGRRPLESEEAIRERAEKSAVMQRVCFRMCKGFAHPDDVKEFNRVWSQFKASEITKQELEAWIVQTNSRFKSK